MQSKKIFLVISTLVLASLACGVSIDLPITTDIKTGPIVTDEIIVPILEDPNAVADITLGFGAGVLSLSAGASDTLIDGEASYNVADFKPEVSIQGDKIEIKTGNLEIDGIPNFDEKVKNVWNFEFGSKPIDLNIKSGAYIGDLELGGLSLTNLHISDGAAEVGLNFNQPNQIQMETLRYETGASNITLTNLANANFSTMIFQSGAGNYELDFSGQLQQNSTVFIETGLSSVTIIVPETTNVELATEGGFANITSRGHWKQSGNKYSIAGDGPTLTITVEMNAGNLILDHP